MQKYVRQQQKSMSRNNSYDFISGPADLESACFQNAIVSRSVRKMVQQVQMREKHPGRCILSVIPRNDCLDVE